MHVSAQHVSVRHGVQSDAQLRREFLDLVALKSPVRSAL
jgi:hypothetical protein